MITFKKFLQEKALNQGTYSAVIQKYGDDALLGLELEVWIPKGSKHHAETEAGERGTVNIGGFNTVKQFEEYFTMSGRDRAQIQTDYGEWLTAKQDEWVEDTWEQYVDADEEESSKSRAEKNARREAAASFNEKNPKYSWKQWYLETYDDPYKFIGEYNLDPTHGWAYENGDESEVYAEPEAAGEDKPGWDDTAQSFALALEDLIGEEVEVRKSPGGKVTKWKIVEDTSLVPDDQDDEDDAAGIGLEIVSPPIPVAKGLVILERLCKWIDTQGAVTNESTGIHANLSIPGLRTKLDPLKLVLFMGDEHILQKFNRLRNTFAVPATRDIVDGIQKRGKIPKDGQELLDFARDGLNTSAKYRSVNLQHMDQGYLEFRAVGNTDYHKRYDEIAEAIGRWLTVIDLACDPDRERKEYMKKVSLLIGKTRDAVETKTVGDLDIEGLIKTLGKSVTPNGNEIWSRVQRALSGNEQDKSAVPLDIAILLGKNTTYKPSFAQRVGMAKLISQLGSSASKITSDAKVASSRDRVSVDKFLEVFKLPRK